MVRIPLWLASVCALSAVIGCSSHTEPSTKIQSYEDCLLAHAGSSKSNSALQIVKQACKGKFPITFDFESIAQKAATPPWSEVVQKEEFLGLTAEEKSEARALYFSDVLKPRIPPDYEDDAHVQFDAYARRKEKIHSAKTAAEAPAGATQ